MLCPSSWQAKNYLPCLSIANFGLACGPYQKTPQRVRWWGAWHLSTLLRAALGLLKLSSFWLQHSTSHQAAAQHIPPGVHLSISSGMREKRLRCCLPETWARAKLLRGGTQLWESCSAVTPQWDALTARAFRQSSERRGSTWSHINPLDRVETPASGLASKKLYLVTPSSVGVTGLQSPEEQKQAVNQGQLFWSVNFKSVLQAVRNAHFTLWNNLFLRVSVKFCRAVFCKNNCFAP